MKDSKRNQKQIAYKYQCEGCKRNFTSKNKQWFCTECGQKLVFIGNKQMERMIQK